MNSLIEQINRDRLLLEQKMILNDIFLSMNLKLNALMKNYYMNNNNNNYSCYGNFSLFSKILEEQIELYFEKDKALFSEDNIIFWNDLIKIDKMEHEEAMKKLPSLFQNSYEMQDNHKIPKKLILLMKHYKKINISDENFKLFLHTIINTLDDMLENFYI